MFVQNEAVSLFQRVLQGLLFLSVFLVAGCTPAAEQNERKFKVKPTGQDTPQATLRKGVMAILDDDYDSFDSTILQGAAATRPFFDCVKKATLMRTALKKKYGDGAWEEFNLIEINGHTIDLTDMAMDREVVLVAFKDQIAFDVKGDVAYCITPWDGRKQKFRKASNGAWYMDSGGETKYVVVLWTGTSLAIDAVMKNITQEEITMRELKRILVQTDSEYQKQALKDMGCHGPAKSDNQHEEQSNPTR